MSFDEAWPFFEKAAQRDGGHWNRAYVLDEIAGGRAYYWANQKAAAVTRVNTYPDGTKELYGWIGGGELKALTRLVYDIIIPASQAIGCTTAKIVGRDFSRSFPGFRKHAVILIKDI